MKEHFDNKFIDEISEVIGNNYFTPIMNHVLKKLSPKVVCDVGCGNGIFSADIKRKTSCKLIGIDANKYALNKARALDFDDLIHLNNFSIDKLPLDDNCVDLVICKDVLEHLIDPLFLTQEMSRILRPNGALLIHVPNHFPIWGRLKFLITNNIDTFNYFPNSDNFNFPHIRFYTSSGLEKLLNNSDLVVKENLSHYFVQPRFIHRLIPYRLKKTLARISTNNFSEGITYLASKEKLDQPNNDNH